MKRLLIALLLVGCAKSTEGYVPPTHPTATPVPTSTPIISPVEYNVYATVLLGTPTPVPTPTLQPVIVINRIEVRVDTSANLTPTPVPTVFCPEDYRCSYQVKMKVRVRHYEQK